MKDVSKLMSYLLAVLLGIYMASQFIYNQPIEGYRWFMTTVFFILFYNISKKE